jgi:hypothetical protein
MVSHKGDQSSSVTKLGIVISDIDCNFLNNALWLPGVQYFLLQELSYNLKFFISFNLVS